MPVRMQDSLVLVVSPVQGLLLARHVAYQAHAALCLCCCLFCCLQDNWDLAVGLF
jgi:hypothetical protein